MIGTMRTTFGSRLDQMRYSLLRRTVARFAPGAVQFDEADPILGARIIEPHSHTKSRDIC